MSLTLKSENAGGTITILSECPRCRNNIELIVSASGFRAWQGGALIQRALPELTPSQRESLITGYCDRCWDAMFKDV
jgi:hypothetical protein